MNRASLPDLQALPAIGTIKVLTINTHKGFGQFHRRFILHDLREAIRTVSADLVFLQEVLGAHERHAQRCTEWPTAPQYEFLADTVWPQFAYGRNALYPEGHHGNALLSKFPIIEHRNLDVSIHGKEERGLLHAQLAIPGDQALHAICVHLGLREKHRQQQLELLCQLITSLPEHDPVIVAGDFNDWRCQADSVLQDCQLHEAFADQGPARSFPARWPLLCLDRIYLRHAKPNKPEVLSGRPWSHLSDHLPLAVEVHL